MVSRDCPGKDRGAVTQCLFAHSINSHMATSLLGGQVNLIINGSTDGFTAVGRLVCNYWLLTGEGPLQPTNTEDTQRLWSDTASSSFSRLLQLECKICKLQQWLCLLLLFRHFQCTADIQPDNML